MNTLRLDGDQIRKEVANNMREHVTLEERLRLLVGFQEEGSLTANGAWARLQVLRPPSPLHCLFPPSPEAVIYAQ